MKYPYILLSLLLIPFLLTAQGFRNGPDQIGRDVSVQSFGKDNLWHLRQAEVLINQQNIERAMFELDLAIAQDPYLAKAYLLRAKLKRQIGMQTEARQDLQTAFRLNPYAADLYGYNGPFGQLSLLATPGRIDIAADDDTLGLQPYYDWLDQMNESLSGKDFVFASAAPGMELDHIEAAVWHLEKGNAEKALQETGKALVLNPGSPIAQDLKGLILIREKRWDEAEKALLEATRLAPDFAMAWFNLSRVYQALGDNTAALDHLNRAISVQEDGPGQPEPYLQAYLDRGLTRKMLGDFGGALADINLVIEMEGATPELLKTRGNIYLIYGLYNKALLDFTQAIQQDETLAEAWFNRGIAHLLNGDPVSACSDLRKSADLGYAKAREKQQYFCVY